MRLFLPTHPESPAKKGGTHRSGRRQRRLWRSLLPIATAGPFRIAGPQTSPRRKFGDGIEPQTPAAGRERRTAGFRHPERRHPGKYLGRPSEKHSSVPVACRRRTSDRTDRRRGRPRPIRPPYCAAFRDFELSPAASSGRSQPIPRRLFAVPRPSEAGRHGAPHT